MFSSNATDLFDFIFRQSQFEYQTSFASYENVNVTNYAELSCLTVDLGIQQGNHPPRQGPIPKFSTGELDEAYYNQLGQLGVPQEYINGLRNVPQKPHTYHQTNLPRDFRPTDNGEIVPRYDQIPVENQNGLVPTDGQYQTQNAPLLTNQGSGGFRVPVPRQNRQVPLTNSQYPIQTAPLFINRNQRPEGFKEPIPTQNGQVPFTTNRYPTKNDFQNEPRTVDDSQVPLEDQDYVTITPIRLTGDNIGPQTQSSAPLFRQPTDYRPPFNNGNRVPVDQTQFPQQSSTANPSRVSLQPGQMPVSQPINYSPSSNNGEYLPEYLPSQNSNPNFDNLDPMISPNTREINPTLQQHSPDQQPIPEDDQDYVVITPIKLPTSNNGTPILPSQSQPDSESCESNEESFPPGQLGLSGTQFADQPQTLSSNGPRTGTLGISRPLGNSSPTVTPQGSSTTLTNPRYVNSSPTTQQGQLEPRPGQQVQLPLTSDDVVSESLDNSSPEYSQESPIGSNTRNKPVTVLVNPEQTLPSAENQSSQGQVPLYYQPNDPVIDDIGDDSVPLGQAPVGLLYPGSTQSGQRPLPIQRRPTQNPGILDSTPLHPAQPEPKFALRPGGRFVPNTVDTNPHQLTSPINPNYYRTNPQNSSPLTSNGQQPNLSQSGFTPRRTAPLNSAQFPSQGQIPYQYDDFSPSTREFSANSIPQQRSTSSTLPNSQSLHPGQFQPMFYPDGYNGNAIQIPLNENEKSLSDVPMFTPDGTNTSRLPSNQRSIQSSPQDFDSLEQPPTVLDRPMFIPNDANTYHLPTTGNPSCLPHEQMFFPDNYPQNPQNPQSFQQEASPTNSMDHLHATGLLQKPTVQNNPQHQVNLNNQSVPLSRNAAPVTSTDQPHVTELSSKPVTTQENSQEPILLGNEGSVPLSTNAIPAKTDQPHATGYNPVISTDSRPSTAIQPAEQNQSVQNFPQGSDYNPSTFIEPNYSPDSPALGYSFGQNFPQYIQQHSPEYLPLVNNYGLGEFIPGFTFGSHCQLY